MKITWNGTASLMIESDGEKLLIDPFVELKGGEHPGTLDDYLGFDTILISHGHFDHLYFVPELLDEAGPTVLCTETPAKTLEKYSANTDTVAVIAPGMDFPLGKMRIRTYQGRHIRFTKKLILDTIRPGRLIRHIGTLPFLAWANKAFQENEETLVYEIVAEGKHILLLGSLNLDEKTAYPTGADLLILPYQGSLTLETIAEDIIRKLQPKAILLSHFDDAFPPLSRTVSTKKFCRLMKEKYPHIPVVKPTFAKPVEF